MKVSPLTEAKATLYDAQDQLRELVANLHTNYHALTLKTIDLQGAIQNTLQSLRDLEFADELKND